MVARGQESRPKDAAKPTQRPAAKRQFQRDDWRYEVEDPRGGRWSIRRAIPMNDAELRTLEERLGPLHARQRLAIEVDHEAQVFGQG